MTGSSGATARYLSGWGGASEEMKRDRVGKRGCAHWAAAKREAMRRCGWNPNENYQIEEHFGGAACGGF